MAYRILLADDDEDLGNLLRMGLSRRTDLNVSFACDGTSALLMALESPPDLAVLDMMMPGLSGVEVCQRMRANERTSGIPIVILSALTSAEAMSAAKAAGATEYWPKPIHLSDLRCRVMALLENGNANGKKDNGNV
jgi:DNA-binding response OmpR family regulator